MTTLDAKSGAGGNVSPTEDLSAAVSQFVSDFSEFTSKLHQKLEKQDERMNKLDRKTFLAARPALSTGATLEAPHQKAFEAYVRSGEDDGLRGLTLEGKSLST